MTQLFTKFAKYLPKYIKPQSLEPLNLSNLKQIKSKCDSWKIPDGYTNIDFYDYLNTNNTANNHIGYIRYNAKTGQIGVFWIKPEYRNRGLGKQILEQTKEHMKEYNTPYIWAFSNQNNKFWSNVFNKKFEWDDNSGYKMKISSMQ